MNIKVAAFTVSEKSSNTWKSIQIQNSYLDLSIITITLQLQDL